MEEGAATNWGARVGVSSTKKKKLTTCQKQTDLNEQE